MRCQFLWLWLSKSCHLGVQNLCVLMVVAMSGLPNVCYNWYRLAVLKSLRPYGGCDVWLAKRFVAMGAAWVC